MKPLLISMMQGLGDAVYQRPFVRAQSEIRPVFIDSCWPEVYADIPGLNLVKPNPRYRTQAKNVARLHDFSWASFPLEHEKAQFTYALVHPGTICEELERHVGLAGQPFVFDLPDFGPSPVLSSKPVAVLRPVTTRAEWKNLARSPLPQYLVEASEVLKAEGFHVVLIADVDPPAEWLEGELPEADEVFIHGELVAPRLLALLQHAAVVVGGSGFIIPTSIAHRTPIVVIGGGQGGHNRPERVTDPRMDLSSVRFVLPDRYCMCQNHKHNCDKRISLFPSKFRRTLRDAVAAGRRAAA